MLSHTVAVMRRFNRFYTRQIGLLDETLLQSDFNLTEARVLYELGHQQRPRTPTQLSDALLVDLGYLSRILKAFEARGLVARSSSRGDGRQTRHALTDAGRKALDPLDRASQTEIEVLIAPLTAAETALLVQSMQTIERLLDRQGHPPTAFVLRAPKPADLAWIAHRQAAIYTQEFGWDATYQVLATKILAEFVKNFDPNKEQAWVAVRDGEIIGSVLVTSGSETVAKLRLLYVEPAARGLGLGRRLVDTCVAFARKHGYRTLSLWTNDVLIQARRIYQSAGFTCVDAQPHHSFGKDLIGETWELPL